MLVEIFFLFLIIIILFFFFIFFKSLNIHLIFKNDDSHYNFHVNITFLIFQIKVKIVEKTRKLDLSLLLFSREINIITHDLSNNNKGHDRDNNDENEDNNELSSKLVQIYPYLNDPKQDLFNIIELIVQMFTFEESYAIINLGLLDNNLTIKFCTLLWALAAPFYPLNFRLLLTPEINKLILKSDINIKFNIVLFNLLKISYIILNNNNLSFILKILFE